MTDHPFTLTAHKHFVAAYRKIGIDVWREGLAGFYDAYYDAARKTNPWAVEYQDGSMTRLKVEPRGYRLGTQPNGGRYCF